MISGRSLASTCSLDTLCFCVATIHPQFCFLNQHISVYVRSLWHVPPSLDRSAAARPAPRTPPELVLDPRVGAMVPGTPEGPPPPTPARMLMTPPVLLSPRTPGFSPS